MSHGCVYCSCPVSSRTRRNNNVLLSALHTIERCPLNGKDLVGSLYDAWTDNVISNLDVNRHLVLQKNVKETPACTLIKVDNTNRDNLLEIIDIEGNLRISIALGISQITEGILMLNAYDVPDNRTIRLIDYYYINQEECLSDDIQVVRATLPSSLQNNSGTHIITRIKRGIDFVIVLELPENTNHHTIDSILEELCKYFRNSDAVFLSTEDQQKIDELKPSIFSQSANIHSLTENKNFSDTCRKIHQYIYQDKSNVPLSYILHPVKCIYSDDSCKTRSFYQLDPSVIKKIEQKILPLSSKLKTIEHLLYDKISPSLSEHLQRYVEEIREKMSEIKIMYNEIQRNLATKIVEFHQGKLDLTSLENQLNGTETEKLEAELETLRSTLIELQTKACFITKLRTDHQIEYVNVADLEDSDDTQEDLDGKLFSLNQERYRCYLCSSDELFKNDPDTHKKLCQQLIGLCQRNSSFYPTFADFSYCSFTLDTMKIFQPPNSSPIKPKEINILLLGETGVGKSTFINAFVNYLVFNTLEEAENGEPIVLIPVSFLITIGDQFQEQIIQFGQSDSNEDHNDSGQSVTQYCKSYIFNIGNNIKLRIIDTPGIGDTRGLEQDTKNIEHILSFITNLPYLNAICFLLKPNTTRLHVLFRSCFTQLFDFLGPNARENIIFCFTNTRATFYAPGDTSTLLKAMINELPKDHIPSFAKENTFCFDSESFRYLTIIKAGQKAALDNCDKSEFVNSWKISVNESVRLLTYIQYRPQYQMNKRYSIKHAQMVIIWLVRPMLETIRNALRNLILGDFRDRQYTIEMEAQPKSQPASLCATCPSDIVQIGDFWVIENSLREYCKSNEYLPIFYELKYRLGSKRGIQFHLETEKMKDRLFHASLIMTRFLHHTAHLSQNPFVPWFDLLIQEERQIHLEKPTSFANNKLCNSLQNLKKKYETNVNENKLAQEHISLNTIYKCIDDVLLYPMVSEQMDAIKKSQMKMMKDYEYDVSLQYPHISMNKLLKHPTGTNQ